MTHINRNQINSIKQIFNIDRNNSFTNIKTRIKITFSNNKVKRFINKIQYAVQKK